MSYPSGRWILKYINARVNKMVGFKSANKQRTTVKLHNIYIKGMSSLYEPQTAVPSHLCQL